MLSGKSVTSWISHSQLLLFINKRKINIPWHRVLNNSSLQAIGRRMGQEKVCQKSLLLEKGQALDRGVSSQSKVLKCMCTCSLLEIHNSTGSEQGITDFGTDIHFTTQFLLNRVLAVTPQMHRDKNQKFITTQQYT